MVQTINEALKGRYWTNIMPTVDVKFDATIVTKNVGVWGWQRRVVQGLTNGNTHDPTTIDVSLSSMWS